MEVEVIASSSWSRLNTITEPPKSSLNTVGLRGRDPFKDWGVKVPIDLNT
jgi:hypothetical protein